LTASGETASTEWKLNFLGRSDNPVWGPRRYWQGTTWTPRPFLTTATRQVSVSTVLAVGQECRPALCLGESAPFERDGAVDQHADDVRAVEVGGLDRLEVPRPREGDVRGVLDVVGREFASRLAVVLVVGRPVNLAVAGRAARSDFDGRSV
jgi:hypothetical protein